MNKEFEKICRMSQAQLKAYTAKHLRKMYDSVICDDGFVFAKGEFPVLLVAHLDTVHKKLPNLIVYSKDETVISSTEGIGGDDRCGIYMILQIIQKYNCSVLFCEDEEIGTVGAEKFIKTDLASSLKFNYILEFDRKGNNDAVFYDCANDEFTEFITKEFFKEAYGSFSDISVIAPYLKCAAVNLSCGYYNAHTTSEYVVLTEMEKVIDEACKILGRTTADDVYEYIEDEYQYGKLSSGHGYSCYDDGFEMYYMIEYDGLGGHTEWYDTMAISEAEAIGRFCMDNPDIPYGNILDIIVEDIYAVKK